MSLLKYGVYLHHLSLDEHYWTNRRCVQLEKRLKTLVDSHVRNLLCAVTQYADHAGVLDDGIMDAVMGITYTLPTSKMLSDAKTYITLNTFHENFLSFAFEFFDGYNNMYV